MIEKRVGQRVQDHFWDNAMPIPESGCLIWERKTNPNGYGMARFKGKQRLAHRIAWEIIHGPIPQGQQVLHHCDIRSCVNPQHLFLGTQQDNLNDMKAKKRSTLGKRFFKAKLTDKDVAFIRASHESCLALGKQFEVSFQYISDIKRFRRYIPGVRAISKRTQI